MNKYTLAGWNKIKMLFFVNLLRNFRDVFQCSQCNTIHNDYFWILLAYRTGEFRFVINFWSSLGMHSTRD